MHSSTMTSPVTKTAKNYKWLRLKFVYLFSTEPSMFTFTKESTYFVCKSKYIF